ncbi:MAG: phosphoadenosine phosphosulfate reductase family protein [Cytophagales bacterium]
MNSREIFNPPDTTELTVLSYGAGQDSTAILIKLIHDQEFRNNYLKGKLLVLFSDTLNEHPHTYQYLNYIQKICKTNHIEFTWLKPEMGYHPDSWSGGLEGHYQKYNVIISKAMRRKSCSSALKIQPIYNYLSEYVNKEFLYGLSQPKQKIALKDYAIRYGKIRVLIGISSEEASRRIKEGSFSKWMDIAIEKRYPLVDIKYGRSDCQKYIRRSDYQVPYPSNCIMCPFASRKDILWLHRNHPEQLRQWFRHEQNKLSKFRDQQALRGQNNHTVFGHDLTLDDILQEAINEFGHLTNSELSHDKFSHGHCVQTSY